MYNVYIYSEVSDYISSRELDSNWCYMYSANNIGRRIQSRVLNLALSRTHIHYHKVKAELDSYPSVFLQNVFILFQKKTLVIIIWTMSVFSCVHFSLWCFPFSPDACFPKICFRKLTSPGDFFWKVKSKL